MPMTEGPKNESELFKALRALYPKQEYALLPQVANGTGARTYRHCDALALGLWPSRGIDLSGFEIKSYRGDWIKELRNPAKAEEISQYCNYWWIVAGGPFVSLDELPEKWGLLEWDEKKSKLVKNKGAAYRKEVTPVSLSFVAAILRSAQDCVTPDAELDRVRLEGVEIGRKDQEQRQSWEIKEFRELQRKVAEFEKASGVKINEGWNDPRDVGEAVKLVLNDTISRDKKALRRLAEHILQEIKVEE